MELGAREMLSREHVDASLSGLNDLCEILSVKPTDVSSIQPLLKVRFGCLSDGGFLVSDLKGFSVARLDSKGLLIGPGHGELVYALVLLHPVEVQIHTALSFLGSLVERQALLSSGDYKVAELDSAAAA